MKIMALILGMVLAAGGVAVALDPPGQTGLPSQPGLLDRLTYTGIIKNKTAYEVSIPSENSDGTLVIPPRGWIEYTIWGHSAEVTAYHGGKPFYCLKLAAQPQAYPFMCKKYDFMAEIVKPEPAPIRKQKPVRKKRRIKRAPKSVEGVEGLG